MDTPNSVIDNLNARINAWWVMIGIILYYELIGLLWRDWTSFDYFIYGIAWSFFLLNIRRGDHLALAVCFYVILPLQYFLVAIDWF